MANYTALVTRVIDGDTIEVSIGPSVKTIRLDNIDTRESGTKGTSAATRSLEILVGNQTVEIQERGTDRYGRILAHVWRVDGNVPVNEAMVKARHSEWIEDGVRSVRF